MKASTLFMMGYEDIIPVEGKAPRFKGWPEFRAGLDDALQMDESPHNVGLLTERFPAIDCDVTDQDASARVLVAVKEVFGVKTPIRVGKAPKFLALLRLPDDTAPQRKSKLSLISPTGEVHHVEVLGKGQQFVIAGVHPDTKQEYTWPQPLVNAEALPTFTEDKFDKFVEVLQHKLKIIGWSMGEVATTGTRSTVDPEQLYAPSIEHVRAAVRFIPNGEGVPRETFVALAHAVRGSVRPEEDGDGMRIFAEWASRGPADHNPDEARRVWNTIRRENISIGWDNVRYLAEKRGWDGTPAAIAQAQQEFDVEGEPPEDEYPLTLEDVENHDRIAAYVEGEERSYFTSGDNDWYLWDTRRWLPDPMRDAHTKGRIAEQLNIIAEALAQKYGTGKKVKAVLRKLHSVGYINTIFNRIAMKAEVHRERDRVNDSSLHRYTLNTPEGTFDLRTMSRRAPSRDDYITQTTKVAPDFTKPCPVFDEFLRTSCGGDEQLVDYVLAVMASALTTDTRDRLIWFLTGESGAGKSTLLKHMHGILGDYAGICPQGALIHGEQGAHSSAVAGFRDKRLIHGSEIDRGHKWNVALLKAITGNEVITARRLYHEYEEFTVVGKFIVAGNETPTLPNVDSAMRARLRVMQFHAPEEADPDLDDKLVAEYPAILAKLMVRAQRWIAEGYPECSAVATLTDEYFSGEDVIGQFIEEHLAVTDDEEDYVTSAEVMAMWEQYTTAEQRREYNIRSLHTLVKALRTGRAIYSRVKRIEGKPKRVLTGVRKLDPSDPGLEALL